MKTLILIRHAKSSWADRDQQDSERPLNDRGKRDAPRMAERLADRQISVDQIIYSVAKRTTETTDFFRKTLNVPINNCFSEASLYLASADTIGEVVSGLNDLCQTVVLIGHNPGLTDYANTLTSVRIDDLPTCSLFAVRSVAKSWREFANAKKEFLFFDYPKLDSGN